MNQTKTRDDPSNEMKLAQIIQLYQDGYVTLENAKRLTRKHTGDMAYRVNWLAINRQ